MDYDYIQFLNQKVLDYLPSNRVRVGNKINFRCPVCGDSHKSATKRRGWWYNENASFYCFNCGTGMSGIKFLELLSGQDYAEIKREYARLYLRPGRAAELSASMEPPKSEPGLFDLKPMVRPEWKKPLSAEAKAYLDGRMVSSAPFLREDLYSCYGRDGDEYILIPWVVNGVEAYYQLNDFKGLRGLKYVFPKDSKKLVYGLDEVDVSWPYVIVFEGVYDSLFVKNAVAVGTKSVTDYQLRLIRERYPSHQVCLSFDNDAPGLASMRKYIEKGGDGFRFFRWFGAGTEQKDVNDYVKATGNPRAFADAAVLEPRIVGASKMKLWLMQHDLWIREKRQPAPGAKRRAKTPLTAAEAKKLLQE